MLKDRAAEALRNAEGPTKKLARDTSQAVGSVAHEAPARLRKFVKETEQVVGPAAAEGRNAVGDRVLLVVPTDKAYGTKESLGANAQQPAGPLVFVVDILGTSKADPAQGAGQGTGQGTTQK